MKKPGDPSFKWSGIEISHFQREWARRSPEIGWSDDAYRALAVEDGHGYRPRSSKILEGYNGSQQAKRYRVGAQELAALLRITDQPVVAEPPVEPPPPPIAPEPPPPQAVQPTTLDGLLRQIIREELATIVQLLERLQPQDPAVMTWGGKVVIPDLDVVAPPRPKHNPQPFVEPRQRTLQVVVCGGNPAQIDSVQTAFPDIDIRGCWQGIPDEQDPDLVVVMTKFYGHSNERAVRKKYDKNKIARVNGASDTVKTAIAERLGVKPRVRML